MMLLLFLSLLLFVDIVLALLSLSNVSSNSIIKFSWSFSIEFLIISSSDDIYILWSLLLALSLTKNFTKSL